MFDFGYHVSVFIRRTSFSKLRKSNLCIYGTKSYVRVVQEGAEEVSYFNDVRVPIDFEAINS